MPRVKKEIPEAEVEVKKTNQKKNPTKSASNKKQSVKKEEKQSKEKGMEKVVEKEINPKKEYKQKAFFFPRLIAYIIDAIIISIVASGILMFVPQSENYSKYLEESKQLQTDFLEEKISSNEYMNRLMDVVYDIDYSSVISMIVEVVVIILYFVVFQCYNKGQTIGKKLMHIRVVSNDDSELTVNHYLMRSVIINSLFLNILIIGMVLFMNRQLYGYFSYVLQGIQVVVIIVSAFMVMCRSDGRGIQDYLGNTKVIMCNEE